MSDRHTEQPPHAAAYRAADHLYRDLFENATDIVYTTDLSGHFLAGNRAVKRILGYTVAEARELTWAKLVAPYEMRKAANMWRRHAAGEMHICFDLDVYTKDGDLKTFEIGSRPIFDGARMVGFHGIARDVTERKRMQAELLAARRAAEQANRAKTAFLASMSHEIRTPINGILGFVSLVSKTELTPAQRRLLEPIEESAVNLVKIIDDILDLSRIEAGRITLRFEPLYLPRLLQNNVELLRPLAEQKGLALRLKVHASAHRWLSGDRTRLGQIVNNLVNNAIKFTDCGGVEVAAVGHRADRVTIMVTDSGIGITASARAKLFAPFQQVEMPRTQRDGGVGLGLTITKRLVEAMGGDIELSSRPQGPTRVRVRLPLPEVPGPEGGNAVAPPASVQRPVFRGNGLHVMVVDDNRINRQYLCAALQQLGVLVTEAASGREAVTACARVPCDLIFMDVHMADMDGLEATARIRQSCPGHTPVIGVSADVIGGGTEFLRAGMDGFLAKPVSEAGLRACLREHFPERARGAVPAPDRGDAAVLDVRRALRWADGDAALWRRSLAHACAALPGQIARLRDALGRGALIDINECAHQIAGSAGYVGGYRLRHAAQRLAAAARGAPRGLAGRVQAVIVAAREFQRAARRGRND